MHRVLEQIQAALGGDNNLNTGQTALRTILIYALTLLIVRLGSKRFLSKATAFKVIVAIMLGSVMSRGIDGASPLLPSLVAGAVLLGMHWFLGVLAFRTGWFGPLIKGERIALIKDGKVQQEGMRRGSITELSPRPFGSSPGKRIHSIKRFLSVSCVGPSKYLRVDYVQLRCETGRHESIVPIRTKERHARTVSGFALDGLLWGRLQPVFLPKNARGPKGYAFRHVCWPYQQRILFTNRR